MIKIKNNLINKEFGMLKVVALDENKTLEKGKAYWICECQCGNVITFRGDNLTKKKDCGCISKLEKAKRLTKHGMTNTRIHRIWLGMIKRCTIKSASGYKNYGGRGITVCDEWLNDFMNFYNWSIENGYNDKLTIERKDVNGNYKPDNCKWATIKEQENNKRNTRYVTIDNQTHSLSKWSDISGISYTVLNERYENNKINKDEFLKPNDRCKIHVNYNDKLVNLKELSIMTGITYDTLHERYNNGLRDEQLIRK